MALLYEKTGMSPTKIKQVGDIPIVNSQAHLQELYYLEPLLMCYEENIYLLKTELEQMKEDAETIKNHVESVVKENCFFRKEL